MSTDPSALVPLATAALTTLNSMTESSQLTPFRAYSLSRHQKGLTYRSIRDELNRRYYILDGERIDDAVCALNDITQARILEIFAMEDRSLAVTSDPAHRNVILEGNLASVRAILRVQAMTLRHVGA